jgi:hypothetical protein
MSPFKSGALSNKQAFARKQSAITSRSTSANDEKPTRMNTAAYAETLRLL